MRKLSIDLSMYLKYFEEVELDFALGFILRSGERGVITTVLGRLPLTTNWAGVHTTLYCQ